MTSSAILQYTIEPIAELPIDTHLAEALLSSLANYAEQLHGHRLWLACSGGRDSLALAALCVQLYRHGKLPFLPQLLHVNHGLQVDSGIWAKHVAKWAEAQEIPCRILSAQVDGHDEQAARQARYDVMRAQLNQDDVLLLAHHADDQAETVLMRLIQGAGVNGLSGMQPWHLQTQGRRRNILWRPWLTVQRTSISAYAQRLKLPYIDDPTNDAGDNVRSGLRRDIMPVLAKYNPNVIDNIARSAQLLSDAQATVSAQAEQDMQQTAITSLQLPPAQRVLDIDELQKLPLYRQRQLLHCWLAQDEPLPPAKQLVDEVLNLVERNDNDHQTALFWQGRTQSYSIRRYRQQLYRLSNEWLTWLNMPLDEQTQPLAPANLSSNISTGVFDDNLVSICLRTSADFTWQLQILPQVLAQLLDNTKGEHALQTVVKPVFNIRALDRKQRVQTALASRPQSGKKLYQTLGIPSWMRESLMVISAVCTYDEELPLLLVSPFESWVLGTDKSSTAIRNDSSILDSAIGSVLSVNNFL
ncbi:tRNA lysidine(34) synthetase TilS [Psychrobacter okhotskensis]|uniref:tRNA lysidine(34) synthetase TilS n=1 Tax=Psychrobacter okhotskensis TaxID=212403 RepID=UPI0015635640|nr:tRNA lysidine(34) synthetase TilS [Psychrobacter okhotskensis]NRD70118.1 tRNA lysidine(34) synthetase TilS [Psychrobacter okhotskensis]